MMYDLDVDNLGLISPYLCNLLRELHGSLYADRKLSGLNNTIKHQDTISLRRIDCSLGA